MATLRVVLAEDHFLLREGVRRMLQAQADIDLRETCTDLPSLLSALDRHRPDAVLTDIRMPPGHGNEGILAAEHSRRHLPGTGVVLLSQYIEPAYVRKLIAQGSEGRGYLLKERIAEIDQVVAALRSVASGGCALDPKVVESLVRTRTRTRSGGGDLSALTVREREVLAAMAQGQNNAGIAEVLVLSRKAVEKHINSIFAKLGLTDIQDGHPRVRAVLRYLAEDER